MLRSQLKKYQTENQGLYQTLDEQSQKMRSLELRVVDQQERILTLENSMKSAADKDDVEHCKLQIVAMQDSQLDLARRLNQAEGGRVTRGPATSGLSDLSIPR